MIPKSLIQLISLLLFTVALPGRLPAAEGVAPSVEATVPTSRQEALQKAFDKFPLMESRIDGKGNVQMVELTMNQKPVIFDGTRYDGFRFKVDRKDKEDFVWTFKSPESLGGWYIMPQTGSMSGFTGFFPTQNRVRVQDLAGTSLTTGDTYLIWFSFRDDKPAQVSVGFRFASIYWSNGADPSYEDVVKALYPAKK